MFSIVLTSKVVTPLDVEASLPCDREDTTILDLEAEILKVQQLLVESEKRCVVMQNDYIALELKFQKYK